MKVTELKEELKKRGLGVGGVKAVLAARLKQAVEAEVCATACGRPAAWFAVLIEHGLSLCGVMCGLRVWP